MFAYLVVAVIFLCTLHILLNYNRKARLIRKLPGPRDDFIVGNGFTVIRSPVETMKLRREFCTEFNGIFRVWVCPMGAIFVYNPEDIEILMSGMKFGEKSFIYNFLKNWLGDGLLVSNGAKWQTRRKILTPAFHFNILKQFCEIIDENSERFLEALNQTAGKPIDVVPVLSEFTLNSICETAMGTQLTDDNSAARSYKQAIYDLGCLIFQRFVRVYLYPEFIFKLSPMGRKENRYLKVVHSFTENVIEQRREYIEKNGINFNEQIEADDDDSYVYKKKKKTAMLDLLLSAQKEGHIDKSGVQEEVDTFMFEGHDTTASGLTFCFMLIANHKDIQDKIIQELDDIFGNEDRPIKMEDLAKMKYLECCIKESLRLYPPVHFISRNINEDTVLSNYKIPAGAYCHILISDLHLRPDLFKNPTVFDPDRFLPENSVGRHPYSYIPFSAGPRNCIGQKFAMMEMKIAVARVLRKFYLSPVTRPCDITFTADLVLRNDGPVLVNFVKRDS
ncbi:hypothetical protein SFRURICE_015069 [Spodoptera frugiperda]|nr:hypothetical protein SFRURICE_015069 [Spodoptera frugiperda]